MRPHARALALFHVARGRRYAQGRRWNDAGRAFEAALRWDDRPASWHAELGRVCAKARRWEDAASAYEAAIARDDRNARWHAKLGWAHWRAQRWTAAANAYDAAAQRARGHPRWRVLAVQARERGRVHEGRGPAPLGFSDEERARAIAARREQRTRRSARLSSDPTTSDLDRLLLAQHPERLAARREVGRLVAERIEEIRDAAQRSPPPVQDVAPRVFMFWAQGLANAPPVVRRCYEELRRLHSDDEVVLVDASCVDDRIRMPADIAQRIGDDWTKLSDVLRLELLSTYGGVWMDSTCLARVRLSAMLPDLLRPSGFFAFTVRRARPASWFLASEADHYLVAMMREGHYEYWRRHDAAIDYYIFHHIFEALYLLDERFHALWDATPRIPRRVANEFKHAMLGPYDATRFNELLNGCFVHKLSYKTDMNALRRDSMLSRLVRDGPPVGSSSIELPRL